MAKISQQLAESIIGGRQGPTEKDARKMVRELKERNLKAGEALEEMWNLRRLKKSDPPTKIFAEKVDEGLKLVGETLAALQKMQNKELHGMCQRLFVGLTDVRQMYELAPTDKIISKMHETLLGCLSLASDLNTEIKKLPSVPIKR